MKSNLLIWKSIGNLHVAHLKFVGQIISAIFSPYNLHKFCTNLFPKKMHNFFTANYFADI